MCPSMAIVLLTLSISHWMFGQNQGMGRRFFVSAFSSYPLSKKTSGRWDKLLKPHTNSFKHSSSGIWMDLLFPFRISKKP
jgi:hypothetical protein